MKSDNMATRFRIKGHGGVKLAVTDMGPQDGPPIILVHGYSQAALGFVRQHPLAKEFRLIIPDLRGHGQSDKPTGAAAYGSRVWAEDIDAIITALALDAPCLIGWSMGGWIVGDYITHFGDRALAGFGLVGSSVTTGSNLPKASLAVHRANPALQGPGMVRDNLADNLTATVAFVRACFHQQPTAHELAEIVGFSMLCPPGIRSHCRTRVEDFRPAYARTTKPAFVLRGLHDHFSLDDIHAQILDTLPGATAYEYEASGHAPFREEPDRFNTDLANFVRAARP